MQGELKRLRQDWREWLKQLEIPSPFNIQAFCNRLAECRGRRIVLCELSLGDTESGYWVPGPSMDLIIYEGETTPLHQAQIILHEVCHLLCGHRPLDLSEAELAALIWPDIKEETVRQVLQRAGYSAKEEREAELLASLILERVSDAAPGPTTKAERDVVLERLDASLSGGTRVHA